MYNLKVDSASVETEGFEQLLYADSEVEKLKLEGIPMRPSNDEDKKKEYSFVSRNIQDYFTVQGQIREIEVIFKTPRREKGR